MDITKDWLERHGELNSAYEFENDYSVAAGSGYLPDIALMKTQPCWLANNAPKKIEDVGAGFYDGAGNFIAAPVGNFQKVHAARHRDGTWRWMLYSTKYSPMPESVENSKEENNLEICPGCNGKKAMSFFSSLTCDVCFGAGEITEERKARWDCGKTVARSTISAKNYHAQSGGIGQRETERNMEKGEGN